MLVLGLVSSRFIDALPALVYIPTLSGVEGITTWLLARTVGDAALGGALIYVLLRAQGAPARIVGKRPPPARGSQPAVAGAAQE